jgi:hypothetical protein
MRLIGRWSHLIIDAAMIVLLTVGPRYAGFSGHQADLAFVLAGAMVLLIAFTLLKFLRFPIHGAIEMVIIILILIFPWLASFARGVHSRNFYMFIGVVMLAIWLMTDFREIRGRSVDREAIPK